MYFNRALAHDTSLSGILPLDPSGHDLGTKVKDGRLLAAFIKLLPKGQDFDFSGMNMSSNLNPHQIMENDRIVIKACEHVGILLASIGDRDLAEAESHSSVVMGLLWRLILTHMLSKFVAMIQGLPEEERLLLPKKVRELDFSKLKGPGTAEKLIKEILNAVLEDVSSERRISDLSNSVKDGVCYALILKHLDSDLCPMKTLDATKYTDSERVKEVLEAASKLGIETVVHPEDLEKGISHLHFAFALPLIEQIVKRKVLNSKRLRSIPDIERPTTNWWWYLLVLIPIGIAGYLRYRGQNPTK
jgi:hypothetical protein